jgi:hypothetical protein
MIPRDPLVLQARATRHVPVARDVRVLDLLPKAAGRARAGRGTGRR